MISLVIPATSKQQKYTDYLVNNINELYPNRDEVEVVVEVNDDVNLGINYNNAVRKANGDKIILLHNDMVLSKGFVELMDKHIQSGHITSYTRVEPPIFTEHKVVGKEIYDCGSDLETFNKQKWESFGLIEGLQAGGAQLFFGCMKNEYIGLDGYTFKYFREDDDLHLRYQILGFQKVVSSACVYHFVSKTSRSEKESQQIEMESHIAFQNKWNKILVIE